MLINGDSSEELKKIDTNSVDLIVTDPPYGLSFMGKDWDKTLPSKKIWKESLRVLKPGAFAFIMCVSKQNLMARLIVDLEDIGFEVGFTSIYWTYANGFPKATNISKIVDKKMGVEPTKIGINEIYAKKKKKEIERGIDNTAKSYDKSSNRNNGYNNPKSGSYYTIPTSDEAKELDGAYVGFQPKPAVENIIVVMKPLSEKNYTAQAMKNQKGLTWLDDGRIPVKLDEELGQQIFKDDGRQQTGFPGDKVGNWNVDRYPEKKRPNWYGKDTLKKGGRFPSHLLASDNVLNDFSRFFDLDLWFQFKILNKIKDLPNNVQNEFPFLITPKPSQSEKNNGLEEMTNADPAVFSFRPTQKSNPENWKRLITETPHGGTNRGGNSKNSHPTVKPIKLMSWLIKIGSQKGDVVLDPFLGSGTTAIACVLSDRKYIGIEFDEDYFLIALKRLAWYKREHKIKSREKYYANRI